jgi:hypothetical protein
MSACVKCTYRTRALVHWQLATLGFYRNFLAVSELAIGNWQLATSHSAHTVHRERSAIPVSEKIFALKFGRKHASGTQKNTHWKEYLEILYINRTMKDSTTCCYFPSWTTILWIGGLLILLLHQQVNSVSALSMTSQNGFIEGVSSTASAQGTFTYNADTADYENPSISWTLTIDNPDQIELLGLPGDGLESMGKGGVQLQCGFLDHPLLAGEVVVTLVPTGNGSNASSLSYSGTITDNDIVPSEYCGKDVVSLFANMIFGTIFVHVYSSENWMDGEVRGQIGNGEPDAVFINLYRDKVVPPPVYTEVSGTGGTAQFAINEDRDVMGFILETINILSIGLYGTAGAHIHCGASDENGPVVTTLVTPGVMRDYTIIVTGVVKAFDIVDDSCGATVEELLTALDNGSAYVVVHSEENPDGEIRGQRVFPEATTLTTTTTSTASTNNGDSSSTTTAATPDGDSAATTTTTSETTADGDSTTLSTDTSANGDSTTPSTDTSTNDDPTTKSTTTATTTTSTSKGGITTVTTTTTPPSTSSNGGSSGSGTMSVSLTMQKGLFIGSVLFTLNVLLF